MTGEASKASRVIASTSLATRGIDGDMATDFLNALPADRIVATCQWWDKQSGVGTGLLVSRLRRGGVQSNVPDEREVRVQTMRRRFQTYAEAHPEGSVLEPHSALQERKDHYAERCNGRIRALDATWPNITGECDACGFQAAYPYGALGVLSTDATLTTVDVPTLREDFELRGISAADDYAPDDDYDRPFYDDPPF